MAARYSNYYFDDVTKYWFYDVWHWRWQLIFFQGGHGEGEHKVSRQRHGDVSTQQNTTLCAGTVSG